MRFVSQIKEMYDRQLSHPGYRKFKDSGVPIFGTWDDHDYGLNDAGQEYEGRDMSQRLFLDFLEEPADSERRRQKGVSAALCWGGGTGRGMDWIIKP